VFYNKNGGIYMNIQEMILNLQNYWSNQDCLLMQAYDVEKGAGTMSPMTLLRTLGPEPWNVAYVEPSRRPDDGRYGENGFVETTEVNYDEADLKEVSGLDGAEFEGEESAQFVSMEQSEEQLLNSGYELVEGEAESDEDGGSDSESSSGESSESGSSEGEGSAETFDFTSITGETLSGDDTEITSMFAGNSGLADLLDNAEESDADIEEVLKPTEDITTYFAETYMVIHAFGAGSDTPAESDIAGLTAEIDEKDGFEVFSQVYDKEAGELIP